MTELKKRDARNIVSKLGQSIDTSSSGHDRVRVRLRGQLVASFGIRRGSKSLQGHIPHALGLSASEAQQLARCRMSKGQYLKRLEEQGKLDPAP